MFRTVCRIAPLALSSLIVLAPAAPAQQSAAGAVTGLFQTSDVCLSCHNGLTTPRGEDVSIGVDWRASMMANAARDPYWQAAVRRETMDHPGASAAIQHECSACHMPMTRYEAKVNDRRGEVFANLPIGAPSGVQTAPAAAAALLAADGVSCSLCHQISPEKLGSTDSFTAGFHVDTTRGPEQRKVFGPYAIDAGLTRVMRSATSFVPTQASHLQSSEMCATCHTLYTHALGPDGAVLGELPEQVPYLEWKHSSYKDRMSCQACHMPVMAGDVPISSVLGDPRPQFSRHEFQGGNFFMPRVLNRFRAELGVTALSQELDASARRAEQNLQTDAARLTLDRVEVRDGRLLADVVVENLAGHKLPTAYPSRRAWLHVVVRDAAGKAVFESGAFEQNGSVRGNDNDRDAARFEPHHAEIRHADQVQVYETIMADRNGAVTTGLISGVRYLKDNRVLPRGFDKAAAEPDIAVRGEAAEDTDFIEGRDRVRYAVDLGGAQGPFRVQAELCYQPVGYRWAQNLKLQEAMETARFVAYYERMAPASMAVLARAAVETKQGASERP